MEVVFSALGPDGTVVETAQLAPSQASVVSLLDVVVESPEWAKFNEDHDGPSVISWGIEIRKLKVKCALTRVSEGENQ